MKTWSWFEKAGVALGIGAGIVLLVAIAMGATYSRDVSGNLGLNSPTLDQAQLNALEFIIGTNTSLTDVNTSVNGVTTAITAGGGSVLTATGTSGTVLSLTGTAYKTLACTMETATSAGTGTITYWGTFTPTGTAYSWRHLYRADTLAPATAVPVAVGSTDKIDRITTSGNYKTGIVLWTGGPVTHVEFTRTDTGAALWTGTFTGN